MNKKNKTDYQNVTLPENKPKTEWTYAQRRGYILKQIFKAGTPSAVNRTKTGKLFGVSTPQITKDIDTLSDYIEQRLGSRATLMTETAFRKIYQSLINEGKYYKAWRVIKEWNEWLFDKGAQQKTPEKIEIQNTHEELQNTINNLKEKLNKGE